MLKHTDNGLLRIHKIRHVRCLTTIRKPLTIKNQTNLSREEYKNSYYTESGDLPYLCRYTSVDAIRDKIVFYSLFELSLFMKRGGIPKKIQYKGKEYLLSDILSKGKMIIVYNDDKKELKDLSHEQLIKRLYVVEGLERDGTRIVLIRHNVC